MLFSNWENRLLLFLDQMTENIEVSSDITKQQLKDTMDVHSRWNHCIKMIAISRAIYLTFKNNNTEKIK